MTDKNSLMVIGFYHKGVCFFLSDSIDTGIVDQSSSFFSALRIMFAHM